MSQVSRVYLLASPKAIALASSLESSYSVPSLQECVATGGITAFRQRYNGVPALFVGAGSMIEEMLSFENYGTPVETLPDPLNCLH